MKVGRGRFLAAILCGSLVFPLSFFGQQGMVQQDSPRPKKVLTPEQEAYQQQAREYFEKRQDMQAQAKRVFDGETARENAGDCPDAGTTYDFNVCFGKQLTVTDQNLRSFEDILRKLQTDPPAMPGASEGPTTGPAGPVLSQGQLVAEFDQVEKIWGKYLESACQTAFHQFAGGTGGPSFEMQCRLKLTRDHMRELDMIYGSDLHR